MENRLNYQFPSGLKPKAPKQSPMKNTLITVLLVTNIITLAGASLFIDALHTGFDEERAELVNELDKFYFGFCMDAKDSGYGSLESYTRLCGE